MTWAGRGRRELDQVIATLDRIALLRYQSLIFPARSMHTYDTK